MKKKTHSSESEPAFFVIFFVGGGISLGYKPIFEPPRGLNPLLLPISPPSFINVASMQNHTQISDLRGTAWHLGIREGFCVV